MFVECCGSKCRRLYGESSRLMFGFLEVVEDAYATWRDSFAAVACLRLGSRAPPRNSSRP
jgi:hypothetical protein